MLIHYDQDEYETVSESRSAASSAVNDFRTYSDPLAPHTALPA